MQFILKQRDVIVEDNLVQNRILASQQVHGNRLAFRGHKPLVEIQSSWKLMAALQQDKITELTVKLPG